MLFVGYLYGIRSERRLEEEINYNMAYKWSCGLNLTEKAPDATTLSVNRKRRFRDNNIPEQIFNAILRQAVEKGLVGRRPFCIRIRPTSRPKPPNTKRRRWRSSGRPKRIWKSWTRPSGGTAGRWARSPSTRRTTMISPPTREIQQANATRKADSCTRKASRTASITASTGPWTASTTL